MSCGSELTDKDLSELMGWHHRAMFSGDQTGTLAARIRAVADAAAKKERQACAKECRDAAQLIGEGCIIGEERRDAGLNVCENLAKRIEARGQA